MDRDARQLFDFWFGEPAPELAYFQERLGKWFGAASDFDETVRTKYGPWLARFDAGELHSWRDTPQGWQALILLLDQVPRNSFRGTPKAFQWDGAGLSEAERYIAAGHDLSLPLPQKMFVYLPFEHSESLTVQRRSMELFRALSNDAPEWAKPVTDKLLLDYARRHEEVIERFGRFPHRNKILGRVSTAEEIEFLKGPNSSF